MNINKCLCGSVAGIANNKGPTQYSVFCTICDLVGPWRTRRNRAVESWNAGRIRTQVGSADPFKATDPLIPSDEQDGVDENTVTSEILKGLHRAGFALVKVGNIPTAGWYMLNENVAIGNTAGQPDLWVRRHTWRKGWWLAVEIKARTTSAHLKPNQIVLDSTNGICICWTYQMVQKAIQCVTMNL